MRATSTWRWKAGQTWSFRGSKSRNKVAPQPASGLAVLPIVETLVVRHDLPVEVKTLNAQVDEDVVLPAHLSDLVQEFGVASHTETNIVDKTWLHFLDCLLVHATKVLEVLNDGDLGSWALIVDFSCLFFLSKVSKLCLSRTKEEHLITLYPSLVSDLRDREWGKWTPY